MKRIIQFTMTAVAIFVLNGCIVVSLHPWMTDDDVVFDESLLGAWKIDDDTWTFSRMNGDEGSERYRLTIANEDKVRDEFFDAALFRIEDHRFLNIYPATEGDDGEDQEIGDFFEKRFIWALHLRPVHSVWKLKLREDSIELTPLNLDWFTQQVQNDPSFVKHEFVDDDQLVVTASSADLRTLLGDLAESTDAWSDAMSGNKVKATDEDEGQKEGP